MLAGQHAILAGPHAILAGQAFRLATAPLWLAKIAFGIDGTLFWLAGTRFFGRPRYQISWRARHSRWLGIPVWPARAKFQAGPHAIFAGQDSILVHIGWPVCRFGKISYTHSGWPEHNSGWPRCQVGWPRDGKTNTRQTIKTKHLRQTADRKPKCGDAT